MMSVLEVPKMEHVTLRKSSSYTLDEKYYNVLIFTTEKSVPQEAALARGAVLVDLESAVLWKSPVEVPLLTITAISCRVLLPQ